MELDFSKLDGLGSPEKPVEAPKKAKGAIISKTQEERLERELEGKKSKLQRKADQKKEQLEKSAHVFKEYQKNKRLSGELMATITKGAKKGEDIYKLFLKAIEALSLLNNDRMFYENNRHAIKVVYGIGLGESEPLRLEMEDTQNRLERLLEGLERADREEDRERIKTAVEAHRARLETLSKT